MPHRGRRAGSSNFTIISTQFSFFDAESHPVVAGLQDVDELKPMDAQSVYTFIL